MNIAAGSGSLVCLSGETIKITPPVQLSNSAHIQNACQYEALYKSSINESDHFWLDQSKTLDWICPPTVACVYNWDFSTGKIEHSWFENGEINISYNCLDRHLLTGKKDKVAILWQGDFEDEKKQYTFQELHDQVCKFANVLKARGIQKGDRVCIYLPMIPEAVIAMLACTRIGAIHSVVFGGFSSQALAYRMQDSEAKILITANVGIRGGKKIPLKKMADEAIKQSPSIESIIVIKRTEDPCEMEDHYTWFHKEMELQSPKCPIVPMNAEDPFCILYTSGSTGKPKGIVHTQAGYLLHATLSHKYIFDIHDDDVYWCTADVGWVTGHSYVVYGPLANGCTTLMFEGVPTYPNAGRFWEIVSHYKVSVFYTAPTVIRALIANGEHGPEYYDLSSLRILGSVGEPINPEAWLWFYEKVGQQRCPIVDTWWQTETGGIMLTPFPGAHTLKPGSASRPFFGVDPIVLRDDGTECNSSEGGALCMKKPWPGMMRTIWKDNERFIQTYFSSHKGFYFSGDGCRIDDEGDYWLLGRMDDIVNISGHRIGTAEVESAFVSHPAVAEAAVVPIYDKIKGQALHAYVILKKSFIGSSELKAELLQHIRKEIGPIALPKVIEFADDLPKTRSGKIMRRILKNIANKETRDLGDTSTLANPEAITPLLYSY